jgi:hypothetical protein
LCLSSPNLLPRLIESTNQRTVIWRLSAPLGDSTTCPSASDVAITSHYITPGRSLSAGRTQPRIHSRHHPAPPLLPHTAISKRQCSGVFSTSSCSRLCPAAPPLARTWTCHTIGHIVIIGDIYPMFTTNSLTSFSSSDSTLPRRSASFLSHTRWVLDRVQTDRECITPLRRCSYPEG